MNLTTLQVHSFYDIFIPLLVYVNGITETLSEEVLISLGNTYNPQAESELRAALWTNAWIIDDFIEENLYEFNSEDLEMVKSWKTFKYGDFTLGKVIRGRGMFMTYDEPRVIYAVCPLFSSFEEILPEIPIMVRTAIIPFDNVLIYDGSIASYPVRFGPDLREIINDWYINAKELNRIKTSMLPQPSLTEKEKQIQIEKTNKYVLRYFKQYSRNEGRSEKITNRDYETAKAFGSFLRSEPGGIISLREISKENFFEYVSKVGEISKTMRIGLRRFFEYLAYTERINWELAEEILFIINTL
jgi:hypothetical protein